MLRIAPFVAGVCQANPAALRARVGIAQRGIGGARRGRAAGLSEATRRVREDDIALLRPWHLGTTRLRASPAVEVHDEGKRSALLRRRQRHVDVERHAVPALDARPEAALAVLDLAADDARDATAEHGGD